MLPPGHFAAGYLTASLAIHFLKQVYPQVTEFHFLAVALFFSVAPDLDDFYAFFKIGRPIAATKDIDHRKFLSHAPFIHLLIAAIGFIGAKLLGSSDWQLYSILYLIGTWTHFIFDSFGYGIMWLWPKSTKLYALFRPNKRLNISENLAPFEYWIKFVEEYFKDPVFYIEISVILFSVLIFYQRNFS